MLEHVTAFVLAVRAAGLSPRTVRWYEANLNAYARFAKLRDWRSPDVARAFLVDLQSRSTRWQNCASRPSAAGGLSPATIRGYIRTLKRFGHWCVDEERLIQDPFARLVMPRAPKRIPRGVALADVVAV